MTTYNFLGNEIEVTRLDNDANGNPRYCIHYLTIAPYIEQQLGKQDIFDAYERTVRFVKGSGLSRHHTRAYGGGLKFQSFNVADDLAHFEAFIKRDVAECLLYTVTDADMHDWLVAREYVHTATTAAVSYGSQIRVKFKCRGVTIDKRISYDHNKGVTENHLSAAIIAARLASREDKSWTFRVTPSYSETADGYTFNIKASYIGE